MLYLVSTLTQTDVPPEGTPDPARSGPCLVLVHGPAPSSFGGRLSLEADTPVCLGRSDPHFGAHPLADPRVSAKHARVTVRGDKLHVEDLESKNGTFVGGQRITSADLAEGAFFQMGGTFLFYTREAPFLEADADTLLGGVSARMARLRRQVAAAAPHGRPVLIVGPTGAGKERVARELHRLAGLPGPFVALNCSTLSQQLAESELFGHVRGAFTGADRATEGMFQRAHRGTLLLDEVATLPAELQPKLLRAIQEGKVRRVGASDEQVSEPRIVCATNEDLQAMVSDGRFREDLYARLHGSTIAVPSLDEHKEDLGFLAHLLLERAGHGGVQVSAELVWKLLGASWHLNVRGLEQCLLSEAGQAREGSLPLTPGIEAFLESQERLAALKLESGEAERGGGEVLQSDAPAAARRPRVARPSQEDLERVLRQHAGRVEHVAKRLGVRRQQIYRWAESFGLDLDAFRSKE